ncbi:hypothetical protein K3495_g1166 [Podosphaera aphanis]|nr:hypothetical protein K3495_g1166 [Podosphaera aphanis]
MAGCRTQSNLGNDRSLANDVDGSVTKVPQKQNLGGVKSHQEYLASLQVPSPETFKLISAVQERRELEMKKKRRRSIVSNQKRHNQNISEDWNDQRQRLLNYGILMEPSMRWMDVVREARYQNWTQVFAHDEFGVFGTEIDNELISKYHDDNDDTKRRSARARYRWKKVGLITQRACMDENSSSEGSKDDSKRTLINEGGKMRSKNGVKNLERQKTAKVIDLRYFLELVDVRHRYGANLRIYHEEWKKSDTKENFFFWLDYGEGRYVNCKACPRERVEREEIRYLNREERRNYRVIIDKYGRLCWAKNGNRIDTTEKFKDSIHGIVPITDPTPSSRNSVANITSRRSRHISNIPFGGASDALTAHTRAGVSEFCSATFATTELDGARCIKNIRHVSTATILDRLLRCSVQKNTWIFVADTRFRIYVGIKKSGAFQHSSFLYGSRLSAAGGIKVEDGKLSGLSPLSGHYRTPVSNFRVFVRDLVEAGADTSHVSISSSYAILLGLETYYRASRMTKHYLSIMKQKSCSQPLRKKRKEKDNVEKKQDLQSCK